MTMTYLILIFLLIDASKSTMMPTTELIASTTALSIAKPRHIRAKRQWGGFGGCCVTSMVCCHMHMPPPMPVPVPAPVPVPHPVPHPVPMPMPMPMPVPVPVPMHTNCCSCCMPVCMPMCMRTCGVGMMGGGCMGGFYGRKKREALVRRDVPALRHKPIQMVVRD